jgi:thiamine monophosphate synthase
MIAGEAGADYVAFGIDPALAAAEGAEAARDDRLALVAWWAEIFETACVALDVADADEAAALAEHGADLVDIRLSPGRTASDTAAFVEAVASAVATRTHRRNPETIR